MHVIINEEVNPDDAIEVEFKDNGDVKILHGTNWNFTAKAGGDGGDGGNGGRGDSSGSDGEDGEDVTLEDSNTYYGEDGGENSGHDGGNGGAGASGIQIGTQRSYQVRRGHFSAPFNNVQAGDGYSIAEQIEDRNGNLVSVTNRGRGQSRSNALTQGFVYLIALG